MTGPGWVHDTSCTHHGRDWLEFARVRYFGVLLLLLKLDVNFRRTAVFVRPNGRLPPTFACPSKELFPQTSSISFHLVFHWMMFTYTWWSACRRELVLSLCYCFHVWCRSGGNTAVWSPTPTPLVLFVYLSRERGVNTWQTIHSHTFFLSTNTSISIRSLLATCVRSRAQVYYLTCTDACIHVYNIINYRTNLFVWWKLNLLQ